MCDEYSRRADRSIFTPTRGAKTGKSKLGQEPARRNDRPSDAKWFKALILLSAMLAAQHVSIAAATKHTREKVAISQLLGYFSEDDSLFTNVIACMLDVDVSRFCTGRLGNHRRMLFYPQSSIFFYCEMVNFEMKNESVQ